MLNVCRLRFRIPRYRPAGVPWQGRNTLLRAIAIGFVVLVVAVAGAAFYGYHTFDQSYGISEAPAFGYEELLDPTVRGALVIEPAKALDFVKGLLPAGQTAIPSWLPWDAGQLLEIGTFREAALLIGSDRAAGRVNLQVFLNERIGGPLIAREGSKQAFFKQMGPLTWNEPALELPKRGLLTGGAHLPLSESVKTAVEQYFQPVDGPVELPIKRDHLAEVYLDNTDGELLRIAGAALESRGGSLEPVLGDENIRKIVTGIGTLRIAADITGPDQVTVQLAITPTANSTEDTQKAFPFVLNFLAMPQIKKMAKDQGLNADWTPNKKAALVDGVVVGEVTITGFRERLQTSINQALGAPAQPAPAGTPVPAPAS